MDKYLKTKRKSIDDDLDDSFDFFLPSKLKEKSILNQNDGKSRNNSNRRKKTSPSSSLSSLSQETYDSDMDRVMSVCLSKNEHFEFSTVSNVKNGNWKELTSKMKPRHPLLLKRTAAEREAILSQKLALILVNEEEQTSCDSFSLINMEDIIQSNLLLEQWSKTCRLWSAARKPSEILTEFYIRTFTNYVEFDINEKNEMYLTQKSEIMQNNFGQSEDLCDEEAGFPLTQKIIENRKSSVDIFENCCVEESSDNNVRNNVQSCENISIAKMDLHQVDNRLSNEILPFADEEPKVDEILQASPDIITLSSPVSSSAHNVPLPTNYSDSQKTISPAPSFSSVNTEQWNSKVGMLDRIGLTLLSEHWNNLFNTNAGDVTILLDNEEILNVYRILITVRCPSLISEITEDNKLMWKMYSLDVGKAFFRYVYTGKCDHLWDLNSFEKNTIKRLARIYHLSHLEEVLSKFHRCCNESNTPDLELKNILEKCDKIKSKSFMDSTENYGLFMSKSPESSNYVPKTSLHNMTSLDNKESENENKLNFSYKKIQCAENVASESIEISSGSDKEDVNRYDYNFRSPTSPLQDVSLTKNSPVFVRKSLEAFFQDSFPEIPSDGSASFTTYPIQSDANIPDQNTKNNNILLSDDSSSDNESDKLSFQASFISSSSDSLDKLSRSPIDHRIAYSLPSTSTATSLNHTSLLQNTPSTSNSEIIFSKSATPFPNYDEMFTPQLKKELKKFGLKSDLRSTKAKLILKYIYDQTHPVIESSNLLGKEVSSEIQQTNDSDKTGTLEEMITKLVRSNEELYNHILQFKPIWLEQFYILLKDNGIRCSINDVKDILNKLCITYRANDTRNTSKKTTRKKGKKKVRAAVML